jgi:hypothetical protein
MWAQNNLANTRLEKALREQEPLIQQYVDMLVKKLCDRVEGPEDGVVNIVRKSPETNVRLG